MTPEEIARRWIVAFNQHAVTALVSLYAEDAVHVSPKLCAARPETGGRIVGRRALTDWWTEAFHLRPSLRYELKTVTASVSRVFIEYERHVTGEGPLPVAEVFEVRDGLITASGVYHGCAKPATMLLVRNARVLTLAGEPGPRRGPALGHLGVIPQGDVLVLDGRIAAVGPRIDPPAEAEVIEADGRVLMPGFVDCHTHACWAGDRLDEWQQKLCGVSYLEILRQGGGIHSTVNAVRAVAEEDLAANTLQRLNAMLRAGTTTAEVKSGYGLSTETELKMLRAIQSAAGRWPGTVVPTALLGHAFEGELKSFAARTITETLPAVSREFPAIAIDAYCEEGAWSRVACEHLLAEAIRKGHPVRIHADQFNSLGMTPAAVRLGARSVDHLEATTREDLRVFAQSRTFAVILPATGFHTDGRYAPAREFVDAGGALALATNCNPGSAPTHSMPFAIMLAVRFCGLTPAEAIAAGTVNAARLLGLEDRGTIEPGRRADLLLLQHRDERMLAYEMGDNPVARVICGGRSV